MSEAHVRRLDAVRDEFDAARAAISYVNESWSRIKNAKGLSAVIQSSVTAAQANIETTYIIRLFTRFESILKDVLSATAARRRSSVSQDPKAWEMIRDAAFLYSINETTKINADSVRDYRNSLIHGPNKIVISIDFPQALAYLSTFADALPDRP